MVSRINSDNIDFECPNEHCRNEMTVDREKAGMMARCPRCSMVFNIPKQTMNEPLIFNPDSAFDHPRMKSLYAAFAQKYQGQIIAQITQTVPLSDNEVKAVAVLLNLSRKFRRSQTVIIGCVEYISDPHSFAKHSYPKVLFFSRVGEIDDLNRLNPLLQSSLSIVQPTIWDDNMLFLMCIRKLETLELPEFEEIIFEIAYASDNLEENLSDEDKY